MDLDNALRQLQLIVIALAGGVGLLTATFLVVDLGIEQPDGELARMLLISLALLVIGSTAVYFVVRSYFARKLRSGTATDDGLLVGFRTLVVIRAALMEAVGLFGAIIYLVTATEIVLVVPIGAVLLLIAQIPTRGRFDAFRAEFRSP